MGLHETNVQGSHQGNQLGNEDGHLLLAEPEQTNTVLCDRATARRRCREMDRRSRSNEVPTNEAGQAGGPRIGERKMKNEK